MWLCNPTDCSSTGSFLCALNSPGKNSGVGSHSLFQGISPTQGWNQGLLHCRRILYSLSHQGSPCGNDDLLNQQIFLNICLVPGTVICFWDTSVNNTRKSQLWHSWGNISKLYRLLQDYDTCYEKMFKNKLSKESYGYVCEWGQLGSICYHFKCSEKTFCIYLIYEKYTQYLVGPWNMYTIIVYFVTKNLSKLIIIQYNW